MAYNRVKGTVSRRCLGSPITRNSRVATQPLLGHDYIDVTAHFQQKTFEDLRNRSVIVPVLPSTPTHEFIRLATSKVPVSLQRKKFILFHDKRVLSSGTLAENGIGNDADVYLVEDKPMLFRFAYHCGNGRKRLFSVQANAAVTIRSLKDHLAKTLCTECPSINLTNHVFEVSNDDCVLSDDFHPATATSTEDCKTYTVHLLSKDEEYIRMKLTFQSVQMSSASETVLFVPKNNTFGQLRNEVAKVTCFPQESVTIGVERPCSPNVYAMVSREIHDILGIESREMFQGVRLALDAKISDYPDIFHQDCVLKAGEESPLTLRVMADVYGGSERSFLRLKVHSHDTVDSVLQIVAEKMGVDSRLVRFSSTINHTKTVHEQGWREGKQIKADVFPCGAVVIIYHKDEAFRYEAFVKDTATTNTRELQLVVERKHSFHPNSVCLYHQGQLLDPDGSLSSAGVGMDSAIMVSTKKPGEAGADSNQALATTGTPRSQAARAPSTKPLTTFRKRLMRDRLFPKQRPPKRPKLASQTSQSSQDNDNEISTGSKALVARAARSVVAADVSGVQLQDTTHSEEATSVREGSNPTGAFLSISPTDEVEQSTSNAEDGSGIRLARMPSEIFSGFNRLEMNLQGVFQEFRRNLPGMFPMCCASTGPLLAVEQGPQPSTQGVSEEALRMVAEELGSEWDVFASRGLSLYYNDIETMRRRHPNCSYLQALGALHKWKQSRGSQATKAELQKRLKDNGLLSIAESIENI